MQLRAFESKWDGQRAIATTGSAPPALWSRNGNNISASFPEIVLDDTYYESGLEACRAAHTALTDVIAALDDVESRADEILRKLLSILDT